MKFLIVSLHSKRFSATPPQNGTGNQSKTKINDLFQKKHDLAQKRL